MTELYFFSFVFLLIAGMLSHDRSVAEADHKQWKVDYLGGH